MRTNRELAIWLGARQVDLFETNQPVYMDFFCAGEGVRKILTQYYDELVREEKVIPIEKLEPIHKKELKEAAIDIAAGRLDVPGMVQLCKCLQVLTYHKTLTYEYQEVSADPIVVKEGG